MANSTSEGSSHALRGAHDPSYIPDGNPGPYGGGTYTNTPLEPTLRDYENIFGPSARDIKDDLQKYKRHGRWHLPDVLQGPNPWIADRIDGLITDATNSPFTSYILPYKYFENVDGKIKWNVWSFDEGMASRVPYESAARTLTQTKRSFAGYAVRHGLAINLEHNFMMTPKGRENFQNQLNQLVGSIQYTNDLDVHIALILAPSHEKHMRERFNTGPEPPDQVCRQFIDLFGFMQKNQNALDIMIEEAKYRMKAWGGPTPDFMLTNSKLTFQMTMIPDKTNYLTQGPDGVKRLKQGPDINSYRGLKIVESRLFSMETGQPPRDILRRRVRVAEYYRIAPHPDNIHRDFEFYNEARDTWFSLSFFDLIRMAEYTPDDNHPGTAPGQFNPLWLGVILENKDELKQLFAGATTRAVPQYAKASNNVVEKLRRVRGGRRGASGSSGSSGSVVPAPASASVLTQVDKNNFNTFNAKYKQIRTETHATPFISELIFTTEPNSWKGRFRFILAPKPANNLFKITPLATIDNWELTCNPRPFLNLGKYVPATMTVPHIASTGTQTSKTKMLDLTHFARRARRLAVPSHSLTQDATSGKVNINFTEPLKDWHETTLQPCGAYYEPNNEKWDEYYAIMEGSTGASSLKKAIGSILKNVWVCKETIEWLSVNPQTQVDRFDPSKLKEFTDGLQAAFASAPKRAVLSNDIRQLIENLNATTKVTTFCEDNLCWTWPVSAALHYSFDYTYLKDVPKLSSSKRHNFFKTHFNDTQNGFMDSNYLQKVATSTEDEVNPGITVGSIAWPAADADKQYLAKVIISEIRKKVTSDVYSESDLVAAVFNDMLKEAVQAETNAPSLGTSAVTTSHVNYNPTLQQETEVRILSQLLGKADLQQAFHAGNLLPTLEASFERVTDVNQIPLQDVYEVASQTEIVIVRPNIEHTMLGIIIGLAGESLGNTLWGQTELSVYDDSMHGIWGMSYKYHERAIVFNEKALIRLWDVAYDGYNGGKDDSYVNWNSPESVRRLGDATTDVTKNYTGPSMMVMAFAHEDDAIKTSWQYADGVPHVPFSKDFRRNWPSPIVFDDYYDYDTLRDVGNGSNAVPVGYDNLHVVDTSDFRVFNTPLYGAYTHYHKMMPRFRELHQMRKSAGASAQDYDTPTDSLAFQGSMRIRKNGVIVEEIAGSGHHGPDFAGAASVRAGKGYKIISQPTQQRLV